MKQVLLMSLIFLVSSSLNNGQWSIDPFENNPICTAADNQSSSQIVDDGSGGAIITWFDYRNGSDNSDIYAQKINSSGEVQWTTEGVPVCTAANNQNIQQLISDGSGGAIITWRDYRNDIDNSDIYAQKINSSGLVQWTSDGVPVCTAAGEQYSPYLINDGSGGVIIAWSDYRNNIEDGNIIYAQKVNSLGVVQWTTDGVPVCTNPSGQNFPQLLSDGSGGAIVTWYDYRYGNSDANIFVQKINSLGQVQWGNNGVPVCTAINDQFGAKIVNDNSGQVIITWQDYRNGIDNSDIYAQKINSSGVVQWTSNGVPICTAAGYQNNPQVVIDGSGEALLTWFDLRNGNDYDIYSQKVSSSGKVQWTVDGVPICTAADVQSFPQIINDSLGGAIITWEDHRNGSDYDIYVQKINSSGLAQWISNGIPVSTAASDQRYPEIVNDGSGGAIITWEDHRNSSNTDIYAQKVDAIGYLGIANPVLSSVNDVMGDQGGLVSINWNASAYDMSQQEVITYYSIWRGIEPVNKTTTIGKEIKPGEMSADFSGKAYRTVSGTNGTTYWEWLGNVPAHYLGNYSYTANTLSDSTSLGNRYFKFFVSAQTEDPFVFWDSNVDSGYSVDNLSPLKPQNLIAGLLQDGSIELSWNKNSIDPDVKGFQVHRSESEGFTPDETTLISDVSDTSFVDTNVPSNITSVYYKIITVDIHGNVSLPSDEASITLVGVEEVNNIPLEYSISQNYPNPFNPSTVIRYSIVQSSKVVLKVYNVLGKEVITLVNEEKNPGNYKVEFNAYGLTSGVYFYRIQAGSFNYIRKMLLIK